MTAQMKWRRLLATATTGLLVASGLAIAPAVANAAPGDGEVANATLDWGVKTSFRNYITSPIAKGSVTNLGATTGSGPYSWTGGTGTANLDGTGVDVAFGENDGVHFQGHAEGEESILDLTFTQPQLKVTSPTTAELYLDVDGREFVDTTTLGEFYSFDDVHFADVTLPAPTVSGSTYTWTNAAATMTADGLDAFGGFYNASTAGLDPITFSAPIAAVPAAETTTSIAASAVTATEGDSVEFTATVAPAEAAGAVVFSNRTANGAGEISPAIPVESGVAKFTTDALPAGANQVEAKFTPTDASAFAGSTSTSTTVTVEEQKVWTPKIEVFLEDGVTPVGDTRVSAGDEIVVKGEGYDPEANIGGRGVPIPNTLPQGTYVVFGEFGENWKPSENAASAQRLIATQGWALSEATLDQVPAMYQGTIRAQWVPINADGSFEWTTTLQDRDASKPAPENGSYGVFTYAAGGVKNAAQEQEARVNYGAPVVETSTELKSDVASVRAGDEVTLTANVTPADQAGSVRFSNGSTALGEAVEVTNGVATLQTSELPVGANEITAEFVPANTSDVVGSKSAAVTVTVAAVPAISIDGEKPSAAQVRQGEPIEFAAGPFDEGSEFAVWINPAGQMQSLAAGDAAPAAGEPLKVGDVTVDDSGSAEITWDVPADFAAGDYVVSFAGTNVEEHLEADFTVSEYTISTTTLTSSAGVGGSPNGVEFVATIAPETATGEVTFTNNGVPFATVAVANGTATATADLAAGANEIVATFVSSDDTVSDSVSDALTITVTGGGTGAGGGAADGGADGTGAGGSGANGNGTGGGTGTIGSIASAPAAGAQGLASTGAADFTGLLAGGALALLLGAALMVARRRATSN